MANQNGQPHNSGQAELERLQREKRSRIDALKAELLKAKAELAIERQKQELDEADRLAELNRRDEAFAQRLKDITDLVHDQSQVLSELRETEARDRQEWGNNNEGGNKGWEELQSMFKKLVEDKQETAREFERTAEKVEKNHEEIIAAIQRKGKEQRERLRNRTPR